MKKTILSWLLIAVLVVTGCIEEKHTPANIVGSSTGPSESEQMYANNGVQQVQVTGPVTYRFDRNRQWHEKKIEILESKVGTNVVIYCYGATDTLTGKLEEVGGYYAVLLINNDYGEIYVSIDSISFIGSKYK